MLAGCGKLNKDSQTFDQKVMKLETETQMLQQSVEMQGKSITLLESEVAQLKAQLAESNLNAKAMSGLSARVEMLEDDANGGFEK